MSSSPAAESGQTPEIVAHQELFESFFQAGFECSSHCRLSGQRLDLITATRHDKWALQDYTVLRELGIRTVRDGIRWHLIEPSPGRYRFAADLPLVRAARQTGMQVIWDLCHYGWPEDLSPFSPRFGRRLAAMARAFIRLLMEEGETSPFIVPINEISFLSWVAGSEGQFPPFATGRGDELKRCLVRATIECIQAVRQAAPQARICIVDPIINVVGRRNNLEDCRRAEEYRLAQFAAWDMLAGSAAPELGGRPEYLDIVGLNYYSHNQWLHAGHGEFVRKLRPTEYGYRPAWHLFREAYERYRRPMFIAETGIEGSRRPAWFRNICGQVELASQAGVPIHGICLYPIINYPGWHDDRYCAAGLLGYARKDGRRSVYQPLAEELERQQTRFADLGRCCGGHGC